MVQQKINLALLWQKYDGGITSVNDLVRRLDRDQFNVIFVFLEDNPCISTIFDQEEYKVYKLSYSGRLRGFHPSLIFKLSKIFKDNKIDVLHCHGHKSTIYGILAAAIAKTRCCLIHVHGLRRSRTIRRKIWNFILFRKVSKILAVAKCVREDVLKNNWCLPPHKVLVLENSIDFNRFFKIGVEKNEAKQKLGLNSQNYVVGTVARLGPYKGQDFLIRAFHHFQKKHGDSHLILAGDGPMRQKLESLTMELGISNFVHFLGRRKDIELIYKAMDCFVLPSIDSEGLPRALLEAMAAGIPCIGTSVGGTPDVLEKGVGIVVEPKDTNVLTDAMMTIVGYTSEERERLISNSIERIKQKYTHEVAFENLKNIYLEVLNQTEV